MQNVRHIPQNVGHTAENGSSSMQNVSCAMRNDGRNTPNVCQGLKVGLRYPPGPQAAPLPLYLKML